MGEQTPNEKAAELLRLLSRINVHTNNTEHWSMMIFVALFFVVLAFGTSEGNRTLCEQGWSPTWIDCSKLPPKPPKKGWFD